MQFELPSRRDVKKCVVTKETIERGLKPTLVTEAARTSPNPASSPRNPPKQSRWPVSTGLDKCSIKCPPRAGVRARCRRGR